MDVSLSTKVSMCAQCQIPEESMAFVNGCGSDEYSIHKAFFPKIGHFVRADCTRFRPIITNNIEPASVIAQQGERAYPHPPRILCGGHFTYYGTY